MMRPLNCGLYGLAGQYFNHTSNKEGKSSIRYQFLIICALLIVSTKHAFSKVEEYVTNTYSFDQRNPPTNPLRQRKFISIKTGL